jgi:C1A family cysteine protease
LISTADTDTIKGLLQEYGVVAISMQMDTNAKYYNSSNRAFRMVQSGTTSTNHGVNIVGWDDTFSRTKFPAGNQPTVDGAWIIRNSWGTSWHDAGYFYMSYDTTIISIGVYIGTEGADAKTYQYDMFWRQGGIGYGSDTVWFSNIFTANGNHSIKAVAFGATQPGATYEISVPRAWARRPPREAFWCWIASRVRWKSLATTEYL